MRNTLACSPPTARPSATATSPTRSAARRGRPSSPASTPTTTACSPTSATADLDNSNTLAVWLRRAKYRTAMVGKYLNGYGVVRPARDPTGLEQWYALTDGTEQHRYGFKLNENGKVQHYGRQAEELHRLRPRLEGERACSSSGRSARSRSSSGTTRTTRTASRAPRSGRPATRSRPRSTSASSGTSPRRGHPTSTRPTSPTSRRPIRDIPQLSDAELADIDRRYRGRQESLLSVDDEVKRIVGLVRKYGDKRKTFFVFTSDNGLELGAHRIEFKDYLYEEAERVPLIIRGPGFPQARRATSSSRTSTWRRRSPRSPALRPARVMDGIPLLPLAKDPADRGQPRRFCSRALDIGAFGDRQRALGVQPLEQRGRGALQPRRRPVRAHQPALRLRGLEPHRHPRPARRRLAQLKTCAGPSCHLGG